MQAVLPDACSLILCAGPLEPHKGFLDAIWAFDILQFLYEGLRLVVAGAGPDGPRLRRFAQVTGASRRVHFAGRLPDLPAILDRAAVVWVPSRAEAGVNIALEAMARGRPVVASRLPGLAEIIRDGETGFLARPGDKVELARLTRQLLDSAPLRQRFGEVARRRAAERFSLSALLQSMSDLYAMGKAA